jgi:hypothetical protein
MTQEILPPIDSVGDAYLEILSRRKSLYLLPAVRLWMIELLDGSGAPFISGHIHNIPPGTTPPPLNLTTMNSAEGTNIRAFLGFIRDSLVPPP